MNVQFAPEEDEQPPGARWRREALVADVAASWRFLTILPLPAGLAPMPAWPRMMRAFALIGAVIGLLSWLAAALANMAGLSAALVALAAVLAGMALTGALHEDGLADVADALGGRTRERRLDILRDPHIGAFGVLALIMAVLIPTLALEQILFDGGLKAALAALVLAHAASRWFILPLAATLPPARREGLGHGAGRPRAAELREGAAVLLLAGVMPALALGLSLLAVLAALAAGGLAVAALTALARRLLGGQTGDVLGAAEVLARCAMLLALAALTGN